MVCTAPSRTCVTAHAWWWILLAVEGVVLVIVAPRLWRAARGGRKLAKVAATDFAGIVTPTISVVIPARNEATRIAACLQPLRSAPGVVEVIVVDDNSTDATAEIARSHGATVVTGAPLPSGWVGKIWALQQGVAAARGDVIITLDADTRPLPELPVVATRALIESGAVLATVAPQFRTSSRISQWLHAAMLTSLVYRHGAGAGRAKRDAVANGQCMVFRRNDAVIGAWCEQVKSSLIEDVALVRTLVGQGKRVEMFDGSSMLVVHMFDGVADTWRGWGRSLSLSGVDSKLRQFADLAVTAVSLVLPLWLLVVGFATPVTAVLLVTRLGTLVGARRVYERAGVGYWLSPIADVCAWIVVARGVLAPSRQWRGRKY